MSFRLPLNSPAARRSSLAPIPSYRAVPPQRFAPSRVAAHLISGLLAIVLLAIAGCQMPNKQGIGNPNQRLAGVVFNNPVSAVPTNDPINLRGARNETVHFTIQINDFPRLEPKEQNALRLTSPQLSAEVALPASIYSAYQVLPMPVEANRAAFVRHTGLTITSGRMPRALLPLPLSDGGIDLLSLRNADAPPQAASHSDDPGAPPPMIWIDIQIPPTATPGQYQFQCELIDDGKAVAALPISLTIDDFVVPDERHLLMIGRVEWDSLTRLYPDEFRSTNPTLLSRRPEHAKRIRILDQLVKLTQAHRTQIIFPRLQPVVKWPLGQGPDVDWEDFDGIVRPWLSGEQFPDLVPLGYWPIPFIDRLDLHGPADRAAYWKNAAGHFDQLDWISRSAVPLMARVDGRVSLAESIELSEQAGQVLRDHPRVRVIVPLQEEQVHLATPEHLRRIDPGSLDRVIYAAPAIVSAPPVQQLPKGVGIRALRSDLAGLIPYIGAGADQRESRLWAWLAFLRDARMIHWPSIAPSQIDPGTAASPDELVWFYPGAWFGVDQPIPTIQLKWLRRAQQDYEYLWLARQRGQGNRAMTLARLISKPVEVQADQIPDATHALLCGTSDPAAWNEVFDLLGRTIRVSQPGQAVDAAAQQQLEYDVAAWSKNQEHPLLLARSVEFSPGLSDGNGNEWLDLRLSVDLYNASSLQPEKSALSWAGVPPAWQPGPPTDVPQPTPFAVNRFSIGARVNLSKVDAAAAQPVRVHFIEGFSGRSFPLAASVPLAFSERRITAPPRLDGDLRDWQIEDALHQGALTLMLGRPGVQRQETAPAPTPSAIYSCWTASHLYLSFNVDGTDAPLTNAGTSFVNYDFRRAWGEDNCELLIQPIYSDGHHGPLIHIAAKPKGQFELSRRLDPRANLNPWQAYASSGVRYAANVQKTVWRGELEIPWDTIADPTRSGRRPAFLRFNFSHHRASTGQSASWAGPVDFGRDDAFMGLLEIRQPQR